MGGTEVMTLSMVTASETFSIKGEESEVPAVGEGSLRGLFKVGSILAHLWPEGIL